MAITNTKHDPNVAADTIIPSTPEANLTSEVDCVHVNVANDIQNARMHIVIIIFIHSSLDILIRPRIRETLINPPPCVGTEPIASAPMNKITQPNKQVSFASYEFAQKKRVTRRERFLAEMEQVVPWPRLQAIVEPAYPSAGRVGRQPIGVGRMLRMYCLQQWFALADEALEDALYDSQATQVRHFSASFCSTAVLTLR